MMLQSTCRHARHMWAWCRRKFNDAHCAGRCGEDVERSMQKHMHPCATRVGMVLKRNSMAPVAP
eukprot:3436379-Karenia_brevis.AAC.1